MSKIRKIMGSRKFWLFVDAILGDLSTVGLVLNIVLIANGANTLSNWVSAVMHGVLVLFWTFAFSYDIAHMLRGE